MHINRWAIWGSLALIAFVILGNLTGPAVWALHLEQPQLQTTPCVPGTVPCRTPRPPTLPPAPFAAEARAPAAMAPAAKIRVFSPECTA